MSELQLSDLAPGGVLRAAINTGNRALVQLSGERLAGVSPALARRLADAIGVPLQPVIFEGAGKVAAAASDDVWDVAFLAKDPTRMDRLAFTRPYVVIEAVWAVRSDSPLRSAEEVDRPGIRAVVARGSAYDLFLSREARHMEIVRADDPPASFALFDDGVGDAIGGVRQSISGYFGDRQDIRVLDGVITGVEQTMALPLAKAGYIPLLDAFVTEAIADGTVRQALEDSGQGSLRIPE